MQTVRWKSGLKKNKTEKLYYRYTGHSGKIMIYFCQIENYLKEKWTYVRKGNEMRTVFASYLITELYSQALRNYQGLNCMLSNKYKANMCSQKSLSLLS